MNNNNNNNNSHSVTGGGLTIGGRDLMSFQFSPTLKNKLLKNGYRYTSDIPADMKPLELSKEIGVTPEEALQLIRTVNGAPLKDKTFGKSAFELLKEQNSQIPIVTFNSGIDDMLGGGVPIGKMTEFCGVPGIGKTQFGLQLAANVHIPNSFGGAEGKCIYIDTEGSFVAERVLQIAEALVNHLLLVTSSKPQTDDTTLINNTNTNTNNNDTTTNGNHNNQINIVDGGSSGSDNIPTSTHINHNNNGDDDDDGQTAEGGGGEGSNNMMIMDDNMEKKIPSIEEILKNIYYYRVHDYIEQIAVINSLEALLRSQTSSEKAIKLIVIDSIAYHFRHDFENMQQRTRLLNSMAQQLLEYAETYSLAVVLINQVTTKSSESSKSPSSSSSSSQMSLVPALGESWGHTSTNRVMLFWKDNQRYAYLYKSPSQKENTVPFQITKEGIRDV